MPCPDCERTLRRFKALLVDYENLKVEFAAALRERNAARNELAAKPKRHRKMAEAEAVFEYWRLSLHPQAKALNGKRLKNVLDRLDDGWSVVDLVRAVDGAVADAFTGGNGVRHDDLELICREDASVRRFLQRAEAAEVELDRKLGVVA